LSPKNKEVARYPVIGPASHPQMKKRPSGTSMHAVGQRGGPGQQTSKFRSSGGRGRLIEPTKEVDRGKDDDPLEGSQDQQTPIPGHQVRDTASDRRGQDQVVFLIIGNPMDGIDWGDDC